MYNPTPLTYPHLDVIDGTEGMERIGPVRGTPVDHSVFAATDWPVANSLAVDLMSADFTLIDPLFQFPFKNQEPQDVDPVKLTV